MEIRRAVEKDIPTLLNLLSQVLELHASLRPDLFQRGTTKYNKEQLIEKVKDDNNPIFVAVIDDKVVGYAMTQIRLSKTPAFPKTIFYLDDLCVDEAYRHQGIGEALFNHVKQEAKNRGCYELTLNAWLDNKRAMTFYKKMGMKERTVIMEYILEDKYYGK